MQRYLRLLLLIPLLGTPACAADAVAGPEPAPGPEAQAVVQAPPEAQAVEEAAPAPVPLHRCARFITPPPTEPLYIVDGVVVPSLAGVDDDDVDSLEVLKGDVAAALYGTRAARGAIIITTRGAASLRR